jgi:hypothetical protein
VNRQLARLRRRWEDEIRIYAKGIGLEDVEWIHLTEDKNRWRAFMSTIMNLRVV